MDELTMKLVDRLLAAERMNTIYEMKLNRLTELICDTEREKAENCKKYNYSHRSIDDVDITTAKVRKATGIQSEISTIELFRQLDNIGTDEEE